MKNGYTMSQIKRELEDSGYFDNQEDVKAILENMRELLGAIYIQNQRQYDLLSIIADKLGADAVGLTKIHAQGKHLAPEPSFVFEEIEPKVE